MSDEQKDPPILPLNYCSGVTVIDIGDLRVARGKTRRPFSGCKHLRLVYDTDERRIWCRDCERDVEAFDAFVLVAERASGFYEQNNRRAKELDEAEKFQLRTRAAKKLDEAWRSRTMAPCCPHCNRGLLPEDVARGLSSVGIEYERRRRAAQKEG